MSASVVSDTVDEVVDAVQAVNLSFLFRLSMWWRIFYGFLRIFLGIALLRLVGQSFTGLAYALMEHEFTGPKGDAVLERLYHIFTNYDFTVTYFLAAYFLFWGVIDIVLSSCLLKHIRAAFPVAMGLIVLFILYGVFRYTHTHSWILLGVIVLDIFILYLVYREYVKFPFVR